MYIPGISICISSIMMYHVSRHFHKTQFESHSRMRTARTATITSITSMGGVFADEVKHVKGERKV